MDSFVAAFVGMSFGLLCVMFVVMLRLQRRVQRLAALEGKLDVLLKHYGLTYNPLDGLAPEIVAALSRLDKLEAIRLYKESTGCTLAEAKTFIEEVQSRQPLAKA